jgi:hypothetical protein
MVGYYLDEKQRFRQALEQLYGFVLLRRAFCIYRAYGYDNLTYSGGFAPHLIQRNRIYCGDGTSKLNASL